MVTTGEQESPIRSVRGLVRAARLFLCFLRNVYYAVSAVDH